MICRNAAEAFEAGMAARCDHGDDPVQCPTCRLTAEEIAVVAVLLRDAAATALSGPSAPLAA